MAFAVFAFVLPAAGASAQTSYKYGGQYTDRPSYQPSYRSVRPTRPRVEYPARNTPSHNTRPSYPDRRQGDRVSRPHRPRPGGGYRPDINTIITVVPPLVGAVTAPPPGNEVIILDDDGPGPGFDRPRRPRERVRSRPPRQQTASRPPAPPTIAPQPRPRPRPSGVPAANERRYEPDEVVIEIAGNISQAELAAIASQHQLTRLASQQFATINTTLYRWRIDDTRSVPEVIRELESDQRITSVQPNYRYALQDPVAAAKDAISKVSTPPAEDPLPMTGDPAQYAIAKLHLTKAHRLATGANVLVAVIDSAIDHNHPELAGVIAERFDPIGGDVTPHTHGTGMAGAIAAHARLMGVAPRVRLLAARAFGGTQDSAEGTSFNIFKSLDWAISAGARVVNMSFAGPRDPMLTRLITAAHKKGVVLIAAAGNAGPESEPLYPAADPNVIAVSATDARDKLFDKSNRGDHVAIAAPGVDILVPSPNAGYQVTSGTSVAAAQISGIAALLIERDRAVTPDEVRGILMATAKDLGPKGKDDQFGAGLADAYEAALAAQPKTAKKAENK